MRPFIVSKKSSRRPIRIGLLAPSPPYRMRVSITLLALAQSLVVNDAWSRKDNKSLRLGMLFPQHVPLDVLAPTC
jgi:hypothetical protein